MEFAICVLDSWKNCQLAIPFQWYIFLLLSLSLVNCIRLSCGTTWHSAGLLGASRSSRAHTKITAYSNELYAKLEEETGLGTGECSSELVGTGGHLKSSDNQNSVKYVETYTLRLPLVKCFSAVFGCLWVNMHSWTLCVYFFFKTQE